MKVNGGEGGVGFYILAARDYVLTKEKRSPLRAIISSDVEFTLFLNFLSSRFRFLLITYIKRKLLI